MVRTSKKLFTFGQWVVTTYGIENTRIPYYIEKRRLWEPDWIDHIRGKRQPEWDAPSFVLALSKAQEVHSRSRGRGNRFVSEICGQPPQWG